MADKKKKWEIDDEAEYVGNFFGWEVSKWGAIVLLFFCALAAYRWFSLPPDQRTLAPPVEEVRDSTVIENSN